MIYKIYKIVCNFLQPYVEFSSEVISFDGVLEAQNVATAQDKAAQLGDIPPLVGLAKVCKDVAFLQGQRLEYLLRHVAGIQIAVGELRLVAYGNARKFKSVLNLFKDLV